MKSELLSSELEELIKSTKIISPTTFTFHNQLYVSKYNPQESDANQIQFRQSIQLELKDLLYRVYHCRKAFPAGTNISHRTEYNDIQDFTGDLSQSNTGKGTWEGEWVITKLEENRQVAVQKNGLTLWVFPDHFKSLDGTLQVGKKGYIRMVKEFRRLLPGFYMANGDAPIDEDKQDTTTVRFYWNIISSQASLLMRNITTELNKEYIPFRFKILNNPHNYPRADAAVIYLNKQYYDKSKDTIVKIYSTMKNFLNSPTPLFAKRLAPGLSLAEDPNCNESYGQHRSRILAEALYAASTKKINSIEETISEIDTYFANLGIDINKPYLNPGDSDNYETIPESTVLA
jgi:hypothetical protein